MRNFLGCHPRLSDTVEESNTIQRVQYHAVNKIQDGVDPHLDNQPKFLLHSYSGKMLSPIVFIDVLLLVVSAASNPLVNASSQPTININISMISSTSISVDNESNIENITSTTPLTRSQIIRSTEKATAPTDDSTTQQSKVLATTPTTTATATSGETMKPTYSSQSPLLIARTKLVRELLDPWNTWGNVVAPIQEGPIQVDFNSKIILVLIQTLPR